MSEKRSVYPVISLRGLTILPGEILHFDAGRKRTVAALHAAMLEDNMVFLCAQKDARMRDIEPEDLCEMGCICSIKQLIKMPGDSIRVLAEGIERAHIARYISSDPYFEAEICAVEDAECDEVLAEALRRKLLECFDEYLEVSDRAGRDAVLHSDESMSGSISLKATSASTKRNIGKWV